MGCCIAFQQPARLHVKTDLFSVKGRQVSVVVSAITTASGDTTSEWQCSCGQNHSTLTNGMHLADEAWKTLSVVSSCIT